jgi:hypothetical protein
MNENGARGRPSRQIRFHSPGGRGPFSGPGFARRFFFLLLCGPSSLVLGCWPARFLVLNLLVSFCLERVVVDDFFPCSGVVG